MSETLTIIIAGAGLSVHGFTFPVDVPIMGVSSGALHVPEMAHFVSCDRPVNFPQWLVDSDRFNKHVPANDFAAHWKRYPRVEAHPVTEGATPGFVTGEAITQSGRLPRNHSLLFAVQVAAKLGYDRCIFIGCDLLEREHWPISDVLREWYPLARAWGIEWLNASPISTLREWMPSLSSFSSTAVPVTSRDGGLLVGGLA